MSKEGTVTSKTLSLRTFITVIISLTITVILVLSILFFYKGTSYILINEYEQSITAQLSQVNQQISEQIDALDSIIPMFLSNSLISNTLESINYNSVTYDSKISIEKQMSHTYYSTSLSSKNFINGIHIFSDDGTEFYIPTSGKSERDIDLNQKLLDNIDPSDPGLICMSLYSEYKSIFFARNIFSSNTGRHIGIFIVDVAPVNWIQFCAKGLDPSWFIYLYNNEMSILSNEDMEVQSAQLLTQIAPQNSTVSFQELTLSGEPYFVAAQELQGLHITSAVAAPKLLMMSDLNQTLKSYLLLMSGIVLIALAAAVVLSRAVTRPINKMVFHINEISQGRQDSLPPLKMHYEFQIWMNAFNEMLKKLDISYNDNFQKQLLLKNAEIQALQSQMDPHFLFNVLNTIAWKAQMSDNEEIYDMIISLGELLRINTISKESAYTLLEQEMKYVKFYIYLQQMRFEDKISFDIQVPDSLMQCKIPGFCIQPLVENAIVHGLEPKKGNGKLSINIIETKRYMEISINDNGIGFETVPDIRQIASKNDGSHTHVGLKNLDKRLELLYGEESRLHILSTPNVCTSISFRIPIHTDVPEL
ncbi:sensor histidine kinase [Robinsoniella peoriensis]|uniref:Sensor histidine kinase YpdA n=1 Tax=Robinsoniella peoriensis TaxID=180332 RepID=A0A4U8Q916_9FIRM|nr:sensor histidine kinase [Robinsoniella peoriensis]MDU7029502.1 sensor histidine kinase [Clostridiales bacterium]TLD01482.1 Sensor histidine kinase YpdA [Robinsoniella peoriensis]